MLEPPGNIRVDRLDRLADASVLGFVQVGSGSVEDVVFLRDVVSEEMDDSLSTLSNRSPGSLATWLPQVAVHAALKALVQPSKVFVGRKRAPDRRALVRSGTYDSGEERVLLLPDQRPDVTPEKVG
jgi:hypothetical protein